MKTLFLQKPKIGEIEAQNRHFSKAENRIFKTIHKNRFRPILFLGGKNIFHRELIPSNLTSKLKMAFSLNYLRMEYRIEIYPFAFHQKIPYR